MRTPWNKSQQVGPKRPLTRQQIHQICSFLIQTKRWRDLALFATALDTGLRCGDVLALRLNEVFSALLITRQQKTDKLVTLQLSSFTKSAIKQWVKQGNKGLREYAFTPSNGAHKNHISRGQYRALVKQWVVAIGLPPERYSTHSLRRTKGALLWRHCNDIEVVRLVLGHSDVKSTSNYLGIEQEQALKIAAQVEMLPKEFTPN